jgi:hypothetical protein
MSVPRAVITQIASPIQSVTSANFRDGLSRNAFNKATRVTGMSARHPIAPPFQPCPPPAKPTATLNMRAVRPMAVTHATRVLVTPPHRARDAASSRRRQADGDARVADAASEGSSSDARKARCCAMVDSAGHPQFTQASVAGPFEWPQAPQLHAYSGMRRLPTNERDFPVPSQPLRVAAYGN